MYQNNKKEFRVNILQSWKQSLSLFAPAQFAQFVRDVAKSILETYTILCTRWVPIVVMLGMVCAGSVFTYVVMPQMFDPEKMGLNTALLFFLLPIFKWVLLQLFLLITYAAARSSLDIKNNAYFLRFWWPFSLLMVIAFAFRELGLFVTILQAREELHPLFGLAYGLLAGAYWSIWGIWILFFLDSYEVPRTSLTTKNGASFLLFLRYFTLLMGIAFSLRTLNLFIAGEVHPLLLATHEWISVIFWSLCGIWTLFSLYSGGWLGSLWRSLVGAITLMIRNAPLVVIVLGMICASEWGAKLLVMQGFHAFGGVALLWLRLLKIFILSPLIATIWAAIYSRQLRKQHDLYID
jgi:hypothetical protein